MCKYPTRYYEPFPVVIPDLGVSYLYITHPFATDVQVHPFDLHVLGMPPALILSQDQTLNKSFYPAPPVLFSFQRPFFVPLCFLPFRLLAHCFNIIPKLTFFVKKYILYFFIFLKKCSRSTFSRTLFMLFLFYSPIF